MGGQSTTLIMFDWRLVWPAWAEVLTAFPTISMEN